MYQTNRKNVVFEENGNELFFDSPFGSGDKKVDRCRALLFQAGNPKGAVVFIHGTGSRNFKPLQYYPRFLKGHGYTVVMPVLPYHFERVPEDHAKGSVLLNGTAGDFQNRFEQIVTDILTCVDYLENSGFREIHIMGISFGAIIATIVMALDPRIKRGALAVAGGNFEYITWRSVATKILRISYENNSDCNGEKCHEIHLKFNETASGFRSLDQLRDMPFCFTFDPSLFAGMIPADRVILFTALFDEFIPRNASNDLWNRLGRPKRYFLFSGHLTSHVFFKNYIAKKSCDFFQS